MNPCPASFSLNTNHRYLSTLCLHRFEVFHLPCTTSTTINHICCLSLLSARIYKIISHTLDASSGLQSLDCYNKLRDLHNTASWNHLETSRTAHTSTPFEPQPLPYFYQALEDLSLWLLLCFPSFSSPQLEACLLNTIPTWTVGGE